MGRKQNYRVRVGQTYWFEYHCLEAAHSQDADLWYRSHQRVKVLKMEEPGIGKDEDERIVVQGAPAAFIVKFKDGSTGTAMEDELLDSPEDYTRPDPPPKPSVESLVNHETSRLIVDALLGDQDIDGFMDTFQNPYAPMLRLFDDVKP